MADSADQRIPSWLSPMRMLFVFTGMSLVVYLDRGMIASTPVNGRRGSDGHAGYGIQGDFDLSNFRDGCLPAAFMVGLVAASPMFASFSKTAQPFTLVGIGLLVWTFAVALGSAAWDFWSFLVCRMAVGVGEASFVVLAAPFIHEYAPDAAKSTWMAIFLMAIPVGYAVGYIFGATVGAALGWRAAFATEALLMLPFVIFAFSCPSVPLHRPPTVPAEPPEGSLEGGLEHMLEGVERVLPSVAEAESDTEPLLLLDDDVFVHKTSLKADTLTVLSRAPYTLAVLGNAMQTALLGMFAYWGPKAVTFMFRLPDGRADTMFGAATVGAGIAGTLAGGAALDAAGGGGCTAAAICAAACAAGFLILQAAFRLCFSLPAFVALFAIGEAVIFMLQAPVTRIILTSVPPPLQPLALSLQTVTIHVFGDVPSPPLAGWLHDNWFHEDDLAHPQSWRYTSIVFNCLLLAGAALFAACLSAIAAVTPPLSRSPSPVNGASGGSVTVPLRMPGARRARATRGGVLHGMLETVEECDLEHRSSTGSIRSADSTPKPG